MATARGYTDRSRVAIVAGASRGIGQAIVRRLAADGYAVVVNCAHHPSIADRTVDSILAQNGAAVTIRADVADELDVERLFTETVAEFGRVDVVVQAVIGPLATGPIAGVTIHDFDAMWRINARATFLLNRAAARYLRPGGSIVNLTSAQVSQPLPPFGAHTASQAATDVLTRVLAPELADDGITINAVALDVAGPCQPGVVANLVANLVSDRSRHITGRILPIDQPLSGLGFGTNGERPPS